MNTRALELGSERRREVALSTMRAARSSHGGVRRALGVTLMAAGRRLAGEPAVARGLSTKLRQAQRI